MKYKLQMQDIYLRFKGKLSSLHIWWSLRMWISIGYQLKLAFLTEIYNVDQKCLKYPKGIINTCWNKYLANEQLISLGFFN